MGSTNQAVPSCFYQNVININGTTFKKNLSPQFSAGPQKPPTLSASKFKYENFGPKF